MSLTGVHTHMSSMTAFRRNSSSHQPKSFQLLPCFLPHLFRSSQHRSCSETWPSSLRLSTSFLSLLDFFISFNIIPFPPLSFPFHSVHTIMFNSIRSVSRLLSLAATLQQVNAFRPIPEYQAAVIKVMSSFLSPANQEQANAINSTLLADDVVIRGKLPVAKDTYLFGSPLSLDDHISISPVTFSRLNIRLVLTFITTVDVTENYIGREKGTEYIWGLFAKSEQGFKNGTTQLIPFPISSTLQSVVFQPPMVASSVVVNFTYPTIDYYLPVQIDQFIRFDDQDLTISSWDITFRRFAEAFYLAVETTPLVKQIAKELDIKLQPNTNVTDVLAQHAAKEICRVHEEECHGANQQYKR